MARRARGTHPEQGVSLRNERRHHMTADELRRKLRNFPAAHLTLRIALAS